MVLHFSRNNAVLVLLPLVQQLDLVLLQPSVVGRELQLLLASLLMVEQLADKEALMKCANSDAGVDQQQGVPNRNNPPPNNRNQIVAAQT